MNQKKPAVVKWALIIGITIVLNLFFNYAASLVFTQPEYNNFCPQAQVMQALSDERACVQAGGQWNGYATPVMEKSATGQTVAVSGYCDPQFTCRQNFDAAQKTYDRNVFVTLVVLGVLCIAYALISRKNEVLATALSFGGVLSFVIASMRYWSHADNILKVVILGLALAILVGITLRTFKDSSETVRS